MLTDFQCSSTCLQNVVLGAVLITTFPSHTQLGLSFGICFGLIVLNLGNLLLMELGEWRLFLPSSLFTMQINSGHIALIITAYLSTTIPSIIAFVSAVLACQYTCYTMAFRKISGSSKSITHKRRASTDMDYEGTSFKWVFNRPVERGDGLSEWEPVNLATLPQVEYFPQNRLHQHSNSIEEQLPMYAISSSTPNGQIFMAQSTKITMQENPVQMVEPSQPISCTNPVQLLDAPKGEKRPTEVSTSHSEKTVQRHVINSKNSFSPMISTRTPPPSWSVASPSTSQDTEVSHRLLLIALDTDSLIHLSHLELLARQWRFQCQHKALMRQASIRLAVTAGTLPLTTSKVA